MCWGLLLLLLALPAAKAHARAHHTEAWARDRFAAADRMREALNGRPLQERSRRDYQRVINAYRLVYFGAPTSTKADPSAVAVAETLVEMGRRFDDDKILNQAISQYKFLRKEYPGSKYRCDALFTVGEIYKDDLNDSEKARATFVEFLLRYPHNRLVPDAQQAIAQIDRDKDEQEAESARKAPTQTDTRNSGQPAKNEKAGKNDKANKAKDTVASAKDDSDAHADAAPADSSQPKHLPRVTAIRHWSTPDYTRVAIDLENDVKFGSQRISHPDRIYFDLRDTKLASTLVGKTFDVDDGFLRKIRVGQVQPGRTRVVLEVEDLSRYDAFLLPNPYRLIIDIHGKNTAKNARPKPSKDRDSDKDDVATADVQAPPKAGSADDTDTTPTDQPPATKEDLKAAAGKPAVTTQDLNDEARIIPKSGVPELPKKIDNKKETPPPTKVIVDNDDEDTPVEAAETRAPTRSRSKSASKSGSNSKLASTRKNSDLDAREAKPTASGDRSLIRALGLKIGKIVIDPGHGGHDTGTIGPNGLEEKDLVLEVGRRLGKMLETRLGAEVVYTRKNDTFIPLETRTAIANQQRADLFISIHANSSRDPDARGVETYYLNFTSSPEALEVAARENAVSEKSIYELQDLVKKIALKEKIEESREFAGDVQESLHSGLASKSPGIRNRGVKKAPFIVLIGANMPSILAEISFVSNPSDEHRLETSEYRQRIAESLYRGIAKYVDGLSGVKMASKLDKAAGQ